MPRGKLFSTYHIDPHAEPRLDAGAREQLRRRLDIDVTDRDFEDMERALEAAIGALQSLQSAPRVADLDQCWNAIERAAVDLHRHLKPDVDIEADAIRPPAAVEAADRVAFAAQFLTRSVSDEQRLARIRDYETFLQVLATLPRCVTGAREEAAGFVTRRSRIEVHRVLVSHLQVICNRHGRPTRFTSVEDVGRSSFIADLAAELGRYLPERVRPTAAGLIAGMAKGHIPGRPRRKRRK